MSTEPRKPSSRGRRPNPWVSERLHTSVPPGTTLLLEQLVTVLRRLNGSSITEGLTVSEALLVLARRMSEHPLATEGERAIIRERADVVEELLAQVYNDSATAPVRP